MWSITNEKWHVDEANQILRQIIAGEIPRNPFVHEDNVKRDSKPGDKKRVRGPSKNKAAKKPRRKPNNFVVNDDSQDSQSSHDELSDTSQ